MKCRVYAIGWISLDTSAKIAQPKQFLRTRLEGGKYIVLPTVNDSGNLLPLESCSVPLTLNRPSKVSREHPTKYPCCRCVFWH